MRLSATDKAFPPIDYDLTVYISPSGWLLTYNVDSSISFNTGFLICSRRRFVMGIWSKKTVLLKSVVRTWSNDYVLNSLASMYANSGLFDSSSFWIAPLTSFILRWMAAERSGSLYSNLIWACLSVKSMRIKSSGPNSSRFFTLT